MRNDIRNNFFLMDVRDLHILVFDKTIEKENKWSQSRLVGLYKHNLSSWRHDHRLQTPTTIPKFPSFNTVLNISKYKSMKNRTAKFLTIIVLILGAT